MTSPRQRILAGLALLALAGSLVTTAHSADKPAGKPAANLAPPALSGLKARVARDGRVDLAASRLTPGELAALRPGFAALKPRVRTNAE